MEYKNKTGNDMIISWDLGKSLLEVAYQVKKKTDQALAVATVPYQDSSYPIRKIAKFPEEGRAMHWSVE